MPRNAKSGVRGLYKDGDHWTIDLRWKDPATGERRRYAEQLPTETTTTAAKERARKILSSALAGTFDPKKRDARRLGEALDEYLETMKTENAAETIKSKTGQIKALKAIIGADTKLDTLVPFTIERFKRNRLRQLLGKDEWTDEEKLQHAATVNRGLATLKHAIGKFASWGWMKKDVAFILIDRRTGITLLEEPPGRRRELTTEEEAAMVATLPVGMKPILRSAVLVGLRRANMALLRKDQVNLKNRELTIGMTKNGEPIQVPINESLAEILEACMEGQTSEFVFLNKNGKPYSPDSCTKAFGRVAKKLKITDVRFHDSRHSFAGRLRRKGVGIDVVQDMGGWKSYAMVRRYAKIGQQQMVDAAKLLDPVAIPFPDKDSSDSEKPVALQMVK